MGNTILYRMPAGIAGEITRRHVSICEPNILGEDVALGAPVKIVDGKAVNIAAGDTAADVYGFLARSYPTQGGTTGLTSDGKVPSGSDCDILRFGYMNAILASGTAAKAGKVNMRIAAATGKAVGDLEAVAVTNETVELPAVFMGPADSDGNVEIAFNI